MAKDDEHPRTDGDAPSSPTSLVEAAAALETQLASFEALAATLRKMPLGSKKHLERAARSLQEAAGYEERLALCLRGLVEAINDASRRQQGSAAAIVARAREIQARNEEYNALHAQYAGLGEEAHGLSSLAQEIVAPLREMTSPDQFDQVKGRMEDLMARMTSLGERAQGISRTAAEKDMTELSRHADALKQQIAAARNKLHLLLDRQRKAVDRSN
ncbi:Hypothetical protein A7982_09950 [Minicystis rosea]|nr:Hypothetical protein A7982_09950 [Minicystis rosea]